MNMTSASVGIAFLGAAMIAGSSPGRATCVCVSGSQSIAVGQATKADGCDLEILLIKIEQGMLRQDQYHVFVKSKQIGSAGGGQLKDHVITQDSSTSLDAGECGTLLIGAHRAAQRDYIELSWSYF